MGAAKIGVQGSQGSGKSLTSFLIALGLSKHYHDGAPIHAQDSETAYRFLQPIAETEGVPLVVRESKTFLDMQDGLREAEAAGACAFLVDSYSEPWRELNDAYRQVQNLDGRRLQYQHNEELRKVWAEWVDHMLMSPVHVILVGKLGNEWDSDYDDAGDERLVKLGTKMKGHTEAGYEPHLLIEMQAIRDVEREKKTRVRKGTTMHYASVLKDRALVLQGRTFKWPDLNDYTKGAYEPIFNTFAPHFERLGLVHAGGGSVSSRPAARSSVSLFAARSGESAFSERERRVTVAWEDFCATRNVLWPGSDAESKSLRAAALEAIFGTRSESAAQSKTAEEVESGSALLRAVEAEMKADMASGSPIPTNRALLISYIWAVRDARKLAQTEATVL